MLLLGHDVDWWNAAMVWSLAFVALAAFVVVLTTVGVVIAAKRQAKVDADKLKRYQAEAGAEIASANKSAADANARAAKANLELARLTSPRRLSPEQTARLVKELKSFAGTPFDLFVNQDQDSTNLVGVLAGILETSGWKWQSAAMVPGSLFGISFKIPGKPEIGIEPSDGIIIGLAASKENELERAAQALSLALNADGIRSRVAIAPDKDIKPRYAAPILHIFVGSR